MKKFNVGIVGYGWAAEAHIAAINATSNGQVTANKLHGLSQHAWSQLSFKPVDSGDVSDHPYQTQFQAFFDAVLRGEDMPHTTLSDAARTHEVVFAADRSAATGKPAKL